MMGDARARVRAQFGVLPFMVGGDGQARVLLVTSRGSGGWVMPKGSPIRGLSGPEVAAREAYEEAGLVGGLVGRQPIGTYRYSKRGGTYEVTVFLMRVERQLKAWPERGQRRLLWADPAEAATMVRADGLAAILRRVGDGLAPMADQVLSGPTIDSATPRQSRVRKLMARLLAMERDPAACAPEGAGR